MSKKIVYSSRRNSARGRNNRSNGYRQPQQRSRQPKKAYIHPSKFIAKAKPQAHLEYNPKHNFADLPIKELVKQNLEAMGFIKPSIIQDQTIPAALQGKDVIGIADTGTGKTAAFAVPMLERLLSNKMSKAIILAPTRELAQQIEHECYKISKGSNLKSAVLIGGASMGLQLRQLKQNPRIIIGTPGRTKDHLERGTLDLSDFDITVLDEVDRMLDMGFVHDISQILKLTSPNRQSFYFSATLDERVRSIIESFSKDPVYVSVKSGDTSSNVEQDIVSYSSDMEKLEKLHNLLLLESVTKTVVFDDTKRSVDRLSRALEERGIASSAIHGGKTQSQRQRILRSFKNNEITVLVATDVAARGLDVADVSHVINYSTPQSYEDYVHRIGRTGRANKIGYALTFIEA
ncbi:DEAD/DEAH box helicase [Candidatus Saccharibacteria bacterium]|nr:DEAD/DEAH box helicase [Candidatus Saccharibacteria bacterium]MCB9821487.1 DEAD/DEAH box helicase [Candidatus Nomurabacteria bacterium]